MLEKMRLMYLENYLCLSHQEYKKKLYSYKLLCVSKLA